MSGATRAFFSDEDEGWIAVDQDRPGCSAFGETENMALTELESAQKAWDKAKRHLAALAKASPLSMTDRRGT